MMTEIYKPICVNCGGVLETPTVSGEHYIFDIRDCIANLKRQLDEVRDNFAAFLERVGGEVKEDGSIGLSSKEYGAWSRRKGDERTREILAENELLRAQLSTARQDAFKEAVVMVRQVGRDYQDLIQSEFNAKYGVGTFFDAVETALSQQEATV
jgi:hypothetical protein